MATDGDASADGYLVAVKPSARRVSGDAGAWVQRHGPTRAFPSKSAAREWATDLAEPAQSIWIQDAHPRDASEIDGYLMARRRRRSDRDEPSGTQEQLPVE